MNHATLNIIVANEPLHLPEGFTMEMNFHSGFLFFADKQGSYTSPISLPHTPHNSKLLLLNPAYMIPCTVYHPQLPTFDAQLLIRSTNKLNIDCDIYFDNGFFFMLANQLSIKQLYHPELIDTNQSYEARLTAFNAALTDQNNWTFFPYRMPNIVTANNGIINYFIDNDINITHPDSQVRIAVYVRYMMQAIASYFKFELTDNVFSTEPFTSLCFLTNHNYVEMIRTGTEDANLSAALPDITITEFLDLIQKQFLISITFIKNRMYINFMNDVAKSFSETKINTETDITQNQNFYTRLNIKFQKGDAFLESQYPTADALYVTERPITPQGFAYNPELFFKNQIDIEQQGCTVINQDVTYTHILGGYTITETINIPRIEITEDDQVWRFVFATGEKDKITDRVNPPFIKDLYPSVSHIKNNYSLITWEFYNQNPQFINWLLNEYQEAETEIPFPFLFDTFDFTKKVTINHQSYLIDSFTLQLLPTELGECKIKLLKC